MAWAIAEMKTVNLGDERLYKRLISLLDTLGNHPQDCITVACGGWSETKAAYRHIAHQPNHHFPTIWYYDLVL
jgi:hypothetical protein